MADRGDRGDVDDRAAALLHHHGDDVLHGEIGALEVDGEDAVPALLGRPRPRCPSRRCRHCCRARRCGHRPSGTPPTIASISRARETSAVKAVALPPSPVMIFAVSSAAAPLRSTQNTCAPSRAKVTAVALPLPQPGPIEPAPTTIATLPLSRSIACLPCCSCSPDGAQRIRRCSRITLAPSGYGSLQTFIVVTLAPMGCPTISDNVRHLPSWHNRHSPAAPELPSTTSGIGARCGCH